MSPFRYFPYNPYGELRIAPGHVPGDISLVILNDRGNRSESITVKTEDLDEVINQMRAQSAGKHEE